MNDNNRITDCCDTVVPISKAVISTFAKSPNIAYARHDNGALYISNGIYIQKADQAELDGMVEQINRRRKTESEKITTLEKPVILNYLNSDRGKFELFGKPLEFEDSDNKFISLFSDDKQYFGYDKRYVDIFRGGENRLFVDDNTDYDTKNHCLIVKSQADEILGVVLPVRLSDELYIKMADVLPLKVKWKTELERIRENPTNDPYIGKEYFDGTEVHIISELKEVGGKDVYVVPNLADGKVSRYAAYVGVDDIENQIKRWETRRIDRGFEDSAPPPGVRVLSLEENNEPVRPFTYLKKSPWGDVLISDKLCPGVYTVSTADKSGIMVTNDMTAAFSPAAKKCGVKFNSFLCFEDNGAKEVALRELLDKKLFTAPGNDKDVAAFEENINKSLLEKQPAYWRSRENRKANKTPDKTAPTRDTDNER